jgi:hypothetical protein
MTIRKTMVLPAALALAAMVMMAVASVANAAHPRPKGATPIGASLVPAYNACAAPNRTHGPPLAFPSCNPPVQTSTAVTVGSPDANGAAANSVASVRIAVIVGNPGPPEDSDVRLTSSITDVRCRPGGTTACGAANAAAGPDYTGELEATAQIRITDHFNAVAPGGGTDAATVVDIPFPVVVPCVATASTSIGSTCAISTSANGVVPGSVKDTKRGIVEIQQIQAFDGGADGAAATTPNTLFGVQGIFIP